MRTLVVFLLRSFRFASRRWHTLLYRHGFNAIGRNNVLEAPILLTPGFISLGNDVVIGRSARIEGVARYEGVNFAPSIVIEDRVSIQQNIHLTCAQSVRIGANTAIAANVSITDIIHPYEDVTLPPERQHIETKPVSIGEDCKIYNNSVILPGTVLGRHTVVAANSVVLGTIYPDYCVLAGAPAVIKKRYFEQEKRWVPTDEKGNVIRAARESQ